MPAGAMTGILYCRLEAFQRLTVANDEDLDIAQAPHE